ncbi:MAG: hypothetical protein WBW74_14880, partial [Xanthobacteraceae bacterium]
MGLMQRLARFDPRRRARREFEKLQSRAAVLAAERDAYLRQRDGALAQRDACSRQRDEALDERNQRLRQRDEEIGQNKLLADRVARIVAHRGDFDRDLSLFRELNSKYRRGAPAEELR